MGEEKRSLAIVEIYRWVLVPSPRSGILQVYAVLKLTNSVLDFVEVEIMVNKTGAPTKAGSVQAQFDDPNEYIDFVLDMVAQLFNILEASEEHYEQHTYL